MEEEQAIQSIEDFTAPAKQPPKVAGSTWITLYEGQDWPVVLCDERSTPPRFFNTRKQDDEVPGILLGKHK